MLSCAKVSAVFIVSPKERETDLVFSHFGAHGSVRPNEMDRYSSASYVERDKNLEYHTGTRISVMGHLSLVVKATRLCNLRCSYCNDWRDGPNQTMRFEVMASAIVKALKDRQNDMVEFIWHGGEPTLLPISFYEKAMFIQSRLRRKNQTVVNLIQTNGTRLTEPWANFLAKNKFIIGISLDGPPDIHDHYRRYASGAPSFSDVSHTMGLLKDYGIPFSVLMVVNKETLAAGAKKVFDFFLRIGVKNYGLLAVTPFNQPNAVAGSETENYMSPMAMSSFLIDLYDIWRRHGDATIKIREISTILQRFRGNSSFCTLEGNCFGHYYLIEPNGDIAHCELFLGDSRYTLGNVINDDFEMIRNANRLHSLINDNKKALEKMQSCSEFHICNGWCPHERYLSERHNPSHTEYCCGLNNFISHIRENLPNQTILGL